LQEQCEFQVDETIRVPEVGVVVGGLLTQGVITEGMNLVIGEYLFVTETLPILTFALLLQVQRQTDPSIQSRCNQFTEIKPPTE
jgi:hypothetical protein